MYYVSFIQSKVCSPSYCCVSIFLHDTTLYFLKDTIDISYKQKLKKTFTLYTFKPMDMMIQLPLQFSSLKGIYIHIIAKIWNDVNQLYRPTSLVNMSTNLFFPYHFLLAQQLGTQSKYRTI